MKLSQEEKTKLKQLHRACKQIKHADKLKAILMLANGLSCVEVGENLLLDDDTIGKYRNTYLNQGAQSLLTDNNNGTKALLSRNQLEALEKHIAKNVYPNSKGIVDWIKNKYGVSYAASGITNLLKRLGFVYKKPILTPCKANVEKQEEFVEQYKELKENLIPQDQIYF
ncbi:MAG: helix-turn-helix domain-containing protein, partial [Polaribacter sp.]